MLFTFSDLIVAPLNFVFITLLLRVHIVKPLDQLLLFILLLLYQFFRILGLLLRIYDELIKFLLIFIQEPFRLLQFSLLHCDVLYKPFVFFVLCVY